LYPGQIRWWLANAEAPPVYRWLAAESRDPIAELPIVPSAEYFYLLRSTVHHRPMINGLADVTVKAALSLKWAVLADDFVDALNAAGVKLIVVHTEMLGTRSAETRAWLQREQDRGRISFVRRFERDWVFALRGGGPRAPLEAWDTFGTQATTGGIDYPQGTEARGEGYFSGWAKSPYGIRGVEIVFENGRVRHRAGWEKGRFILSIPQRPANIRRDTDFQVEITDGRGAVTRLESRWLRWE
jgi:hypothetical protein